MAITINTASSCSRNDVNFAINGGGLDSAGKSFSKLQHGDKCIIPAGSAIWPPPTPSVPSGVTVDKNITIVGGGDLPGKDIADTHITGGALWILLPTYTDKHRMDIGWMTLTRNNAGPLTLQISGKCPIDTANINNPTLSGGFRMHHIKINSTSSDTGGGKTVDFRGWLEGVIDHCVWDFDISALTTLNDVSINNGNNQITSATANWQAPYDIGRTVKGTGIPAGATIASVTSSTIAHMSVAATANAVNLTVTLGGSLSTGEHIIVNHNDSPDASAGGDGNYSWFAPHTISDWKQIYFEDCILKRYGGIDCNQWQTPNAGGARYTGRHCTSWASIGSGHESRSDSTPQNVGGLRSSGCYKNLFVRNVIVTPPANQGKNLTDVRSGENVTFGNRYNTYGIGASAAANTLQLDAYCWTAGNVTCFGGPDGTDHWDDNVLGTINPSTIVPGGFNGNITEVSHDSAGSIYATGTDATRDANNDNLIHFSNHTFTPDQWVGFVIRNVSSLNRTGRVPNPTWFSVITGNTTNTVTVGPCSEPNSSATSAGKQMVMQANDTYEIRLVRQYFASVGSGAMDTMVDDTSGIGLYGTSTEPKLTDNTRRWTNQDTPGCSQWDNKYRLSGGATGWTPMSGWGGRGRLQAVQNARDLTTAQAAVTATGHPSFTYNASTPATTPSGAETQNQKDTRVGADAEVWSYAASVLADFNVNSGLNETDSLHDQIGSGGPTYPHPFVSGSGVVVLPPVITSSLTASSTVGNVFSYTITASNSPTSFNVTTTMPAGFVVDTSTGVISCTGPNNIGQPGTYNIGIQASNNGGSSPVATLVLTLSGVPIAQRGKGRSRRIGGAGRLM